MILDLEDPPARLDQLRRFMQLFLKLDCQPDSPLLVSSSAAVSDFESHSGSFFLEVTTIISSLRVSRWLSF
jgi:hypothetical protein